MSASGDLALILAARRQVTAQLLGPMVGWSIAGAPVLSGFVFLADYVGLLLAFQGDQLRHGWQTLVGGTPLEASQ